MARTRDEVKTRTKFRKFGVMGTRDGIKPRTKIRGEPLLCDLTIDCCSNNLHAVHYLEGSVG